MNSVSFFAKVFLVLLAGFEAQCFGQILCYTCAWLRTGGGTKEKDDNCRPGKLDIHDVQIEKCPHGCSTTIIFEYDPLKNESQGIEDLKNCSVDTQSLRAVSNMTLFARKCSDKSFTNDHCLIKSVPGFHAEERFCRTSLCNGESGSASLSSTVLWTKLSFLLLLLHIPLQTINPQLIYKTRNPNYPFL